MFNILKKTINKLNDIVNDYDIKEEKIKKDVVLETEKPKEMKLTYKEKIEKGKNFELQVVEHFEINGYEVEHRGKLKGRKDKGIDIPAKKDNTYYLIQCKNYAETTKIKHSIIKEFNSNCLDFLNQNDKKLNKENTKFLFILSNRKSLKKCAIHYLKDNNNKCEFQEVGFVS